MKQYELKGFPNEGHLVKTFCTLGTSSFRISIHHTLQSLVQDNMHLPNVPSKKVTGNSQNNFYEVVTYVRYENALLCIITPEDALLLSWSDAQSLGLFSKGQLPPTNLSSVLNGTEIST